MLRKRWTPDDDALLRLRYPTTPTEVLAKVLERSRPAIHQHARILGIAGKRPLQNLSLYERVMYRVKRQGDCIVFTGCTNGRGYGRICYQRRYYSTHRAVWEHFNGRIPDGLCVCHSCDNPACCNIEHLWLGTLQENIADAVRKGRHGYNGWRTPRSEHRGHLARKGKPSGHRA